MTRSPDDQLRRQLRSAGLSTGAIDAAWPAWRMPGVPEGASADAELRFALARRLGLSPKALLDDRVEYIWRDDVARFKHLTAADEGSQAAIMSFGMSLARLLLSGTDATNSRTAIPAIELRRALLAGGKPFVDLAGLVSFCWATGIPVVQLRVFPLRQKSMHAMVLRVDGRSAVLLGRAAAYPAQTAFTLAHELGHAMLGHLDGANAIVDMQDPAMVSDGDAEEDAADRFALETLTGSAAPDFTTGFSTYNAPTLADAAMKAASQAAIEPGTIALCLGHRTREWAKVMSALRFIYGGTVSVADYVNRIAEMQLDWESMSPDGIDYARRIMGLTDLGAAVSATPA